MFSALRTSAKKLPSLILLFTLFFSPQAVFAGPFADSAHGNTVYGVERTTLAALATPYTRGNCGHCHEQHTAVADGHLLFSDDFSDKTESPYIQSDSACFFCHASTGALQTGGGILNYDYSATFGGAAATTPGILAAFDKASYHNLYDLQQYITGASGTKSFDSFPAGSNSCRGCHNIHIAKANKRTPGDPTYTAMSLPSDHNNLWGDDASERMTSATYGTAYQPLYYVGGGLEPDGLSSIKAVQAAKTPDYVTFCVDCHNATNAIWSTKAGRFLKTFDWDLEQHGAGAAENWTVETEMIAPYTDAGLGTYLLSCLDCHEPHGSVNSYLLRSSVNAGAVSLPTSAPDNEQDWDYLCSRCHVATGDGNSMKKFHHKVKITFECVDCHVDGGMASCINCHYHGSSAGGYKTF